MIFKALIFLFIFCFASTISKAQKNQFIDFKIQTTIPKILGEVTYSKTKRNGFGVEYLFGGGLYGQRTYDGKTKDLLGKTYKPESNIPYSVDKHGTIFSYLRIKHIGFHVGFGLLYIHEFNPKWHLRTSFQSKIHVYKEFLAYDYPKYDFNESNYIPVDTLFSVNHVGLSIAYSGDIDYKINRNYSIFFGVILPFYMTILNTYYFPNISYDFRNPLMLGLEPMIFIGARYKFKK